MKYLLTTSVEDAANQAESLGRAYAAKLGIPWPMPPDSYGPGRQPAVRTAYYQRYYCAPQPDPSADTSPLGTPDKRALVIPVDAVVVSMDGVKVTLTDGTKVTLDSTKAVDLTPVVAKPIDVGITQAAVVEK
jgi:hypothetical protein